MSYFISFLTTFVLTSSVCFFIDMKKTHLRVQEKSRHEILKDYKKMLPDVIKNIVVTRYVLNLVENYLSTFQREDRIFDIVVIIIMADFIFYFLHRIIHLPSLYFLHRKHHEFSYTYGIGSIYSSIPEQVYINLGSGIIPAIILKSGNGVNCFVIIFSTFYTVFISHGGYKFFQNGHLVHHIYRKKMFGLIISDKIFNTGK